MEEGRGIPWEREVGRVTEKAGILHAFGYVLEQSWSGWRREPRNGTVVGEAHGDGANGSGHGEGAEVGEMQPMHKTGQLHTPLSQ